LTQPDTSQRDASSPGRLPVAAKLAYGSGQVVDAIIATILSTFLFFYLTAVSGLTGAQAGLALMLTLFVDALADPLIGAMSDNLKSRWGRRNAFMFVSIFPLAIALGLLFSLPAEMDGWSRFAAITGLLVVLRLSYSAYVLPHAALGAELTDDYRERSSVVAFRLAFNSVAAFIPVVLGYSIFLAGPQGVLDRAGYVPFAWSCAGLMLIFGLFCAVSTLSLRHRLHAPAATHPTTVSGLFKDAARVAANPTFLVLFGVVLVFNIAQGIGLNLAIHVNKYFWDLSDEALKWVGLSHPLGLALGIPIGALLAQRFEKRTIVIGGFLVLCAAQALMPALRLTGLVPATEAAALVVLISGGLVLYAAYTTLLISFTSMIADAADEHELTHDVRREGLFFAGVAFANKSAAGVGGMAAGLALDLIGFPKDVASQGVSVETAWRLGFIAGPCTAVATLACVVLLLFYRLDRASHARVQAELNARRFAPG
jgi:GPH family glycoside/pentoside/hexuronide:cation symporter